MVDLTEAKFFSSICSFIVVKCFSIYFSWLSLTVDFTGFFSNFSLFTSLMYSYVIVRILFIARREISLSAYD
jgi:hypothetical protein